MRIMLAPGFHAGLGSKCAVSRFFQRNKVFLVGLLLLLAATWMPATVQAQNVGPVAVDDSYTTISAIDSGGTASYPVLSNDSDVDGDTLTVTEVGSAVNGSVSLQDGNVLFRPQTNFVGTASFTYTIWDGFDLQPEHYDTATVTIEVTNRDPYPQNVTATTTAGVTVGFAAISSQPDPEFQPVTVTAFTQPANGSVVASGDTGFEYTPNSGFTGVDTFTYTLTDSFGATAPGTAEITVTEAVNAPPVAVDDVATTRAGPTAGEQIDINVLANDSDPDGDPLEVLEASSPTNGVLVVTPSSALRYTPNPGFSGTEIVTYDLSDGVNPVVTATVTITVNADNAPVAADDFAQTTTWIQGQGPPSEVQIPVLANDTDPDAGDVLAYRDIVIVQSPTNGSVTQSCLGACNPPDYMPNSGFTGTDTFTYRAVDALGAQSNIATVTIQVTDPAVGNLPPVAVSDSAETFVGQPITIDVLANDSDPEGGPLTIVAVDPSNLGSVAIVANQLQFTPNGQTGTGTFGYTITDSYQPAAPATSFVVITVLPLEGNVPPTAVIAGGNRTISDSDGAAGETVLFDSTQSSDSDGEVINCNWSVNGVAQDAGCGSNVALTLPDGVSTVSLTVTDDGEATSGETTVSITVNGANNVPVVAISVGSTTIPDSDGVAGEIVPFEGTATDSDGTVATSTFRWSVNGQAVPGANGQPSPALALANGTNTIRLDATDNGGGVGTDSIIVTIGEASAISELPGIEGNENLEETAGATEDTCSALLKADPSSLSTDQLNLRATCETIYANVEDNPDAVVDAIEQISSEQVTAQQTTAIDFSSAQMLNVAGRLTALRQGAKGVSFAGLNVGGPAAGVPVSALASLGKTLFGEGGSSGEDEGGLLDDRLGIFMNGSLRFGDKEATSRESGFDFDTQGVTLGADYRFTDTVVAGFAIGYGKASADFDANSGTQDSDSFSGSLYGSWYGQRSYFDGIVSLGTVSFDTVRNINLFDGAIVDKALGSTDGTQMALGVASGFDFGKGGLRFGPNLAVNYIKADIDGFRETTEGTSGLAMAFKDQSADSLTIKAGGHLNYSMSRKWGILSPQARFDIVRELANDSQRITVRYANDPVVTGQGQAGGTFVIFTDDPDEYYFLWGVGVAAQFMNGFSGFVDYESTESLDTITSAEFSFGLRYQTRFK